MTIAPRRQLRLGDAVAANLRRNDSFLFAQAHALNLYRRDAIYSFIPKNGCSTMRLSLAIDNGVIPDASWIEFIHNNNATFRASLRELVCARYTFVVLRDPYLRLVSCYLDKMVGRSVELYMLREACEERWSPDELSFRMFIDALRTHRDLNHHWTPQERFLIYEEYDDYFALEAFRAAATTLRKRIGLEIVDSRPLLDHHTGGLRAHRGKTSLADAPAARIAELRRTGRIPRADQLIDPTIQQTIATLYAGDIALYRDKTGREPAFPR